ncbi:hypothetical protein L9F63_002955, partial [Diploptera punctata]
MWRLSHLLILLILAANSLANDRYTSFFQSLNESLKIPFFKYQLAEGILENFSKTSYKTSVTAFNLKTPETLGIEKELFEYIAKMAAPAGFAGHLFEILRQSLNMNRSQMVSVASARSGEVIYCDESTGTCYDLGDITAICC